MFEFVSKLLCLGDFPALDFGYQLAVLLRHLPALLLAANGADLAATKSAKNNYTIPTFLKKETLKIDVKNSNVRNALVTLIN